MEERQDRPVCDVDRDGDWGYSGDQKGCEEAEEERLERFLSILDEAGAFRIDKWLGPR